MAADQTSNNSSSRRLSLVWKQLAALGLLLVVMITLIAWTQVRSLTQQTEAIVDQSLASYHQAFEALIDLTVDDQAVLASQIAATVDLEEPTMDTVDWSRLITRFDWLEVYDRAGGLRYSWSALVADSAGGEGQTPRAMLQLVADRQVPKATIVCDEQCNLLVVTPALARALEPVVVTLSLPLAMLLPNFSDLTGGRLGLILDGAAPQLLAVTHAQQLASVVKPRMASLVDEAGAFSGYQFSVKDDYAFRTERLSLGDLGHPPIYATALFDLERARLLLVRSVSQTVVVLVFGTLLAVLLMYALVTFSLQRLTALTQMLPMLSDAKNFPVVRQMLGKSLSRRQRRDELDELGATLHQLTRELERLYGEEASSEAKSRFLATMSHEIRTPLNGVLGLLELLSETELDSDQRRSLKVIRESANSLLGVINDVLDYSKLEAKATVMDPEPFSPTQLVEGVADTVAATAQNKGLRLIVACGPDLPTRCLGDAGKVRQVLLNFAANAVKFTPSGDIVISALCCPVSSGANMIRFSVRDSGVGIAEDAQRALFQRFSQGDASTTRRYGGTGLGLAISKGLTELMDGRVGMRSTLGQGSTFYADIPLTELDAPASEAVELDNFRVSLHLSSEDERSAWAGHLADAGAELVAVHQQPELEIHDRGMTVELLFWPADAVQPKRASLIRPIALGALFERIQAYREGRAIENRGYAVPVWPQFNASVLVVEDHAVNRQLLEAQLQKLGCTTQSVENGLLALDRLRTATFDLIITDLHMPELDGYQLARRLRDAPEAEKVHTPIAVLTASASEADEAHLSRLGIKTKLRKPMLMATLVEALRELLGESAKGVGPLTLQSTAAPMAQNPHLDSQVIHDTFGDDYSLLRHFVEEYRRVNTPLIDALGELVARDERAEVRELAHRLKGSSRSLGATRLCDLLSDLEVPDADVDFALTMAEVRGEFTRFCAALAALVEPRAS